MDTRKLLLKADDIEKMPEGTQGSFSESKRRAHQQITW